MRIPRFYCPDIDDVTELLVLPEQVHRHAIQVLRLKPGAKLILFDGQGYEYTAELNDVGKRQSAAKIISKQKTDVESPVHTTLLQGVSRGERMDYSIQKAVELGVNRIIPITTERCNVTLAGQRAEKKLMHWQGVIVSACEQSGRSVLPHLDSISSFEQVLTAPLAGQKIVLDPTAETGFAAMQKVERVTLLIGPEGGLTDEEISLAKQAGFSATRFGPRVLRTETAAVAALAAIQSLWGDLGG